MLQARLKAGQPWGNHNLVFCDALGGPLSHSAVYHTFKRLLKTAGLPTTYRVHDLRHSTATYLLAAGVQPRVVMELLGHSTIAMT